MSRADPNVLDNKISPYRPEDELLSQISTETVVRWNEPLAGRTTLRVGGPADLYIEPASEEDLAEVLRFCARHKIVFFVLGRGSNLLVRDGGFRGAVICLAQSNFARISLEGQFLRCGAGAKLRTVAVEARRNGLAGFEFLEGIPGTVGGGLRMNAGAMGGAIFDRVESVRLMDFLGHVTEKPANEIRVEYRGCPTLRTRIALGALLKGQRAQPDVIEKRMGEYSKKRWSSQPAAPSAGCIFKNPASIPAGKLIDELGLKGARVGGAYVSSEHGNFIVNDGTASAQDVLDLIDFIRQGAREKRGIELETEVEIIGS